MFFIEDFIHYITVREFVWSLLQKGFAQKDEWSKPERSILVIVLYYNFLFLHELPWVHQYEQQWLCLNPLKKRVRKLFLFCLLHVANS